MRATSLAIFLLTLPAACDDDDGGPYVCIGQHCECSDRASCPLSCPLGGCDALCTRANDCHTECGPACDLTCHDIDLCAASCDDDCRLSCSRAPDCDFECGADCDVDCSDVSSCRATVGAGSRVDCSRLSRCDVTCTGPCEVGCSNVSACDVRCEGAALMRCDTDTGAACATSCP